VTPVVGLHVHLFVDGGGLDAHGAHLTPPGPDDVLDKIALEETYGLERCVIVAPKLVVGFGVFALQDDDLVREDSVPLRIP
jgi:hypothetical protein